MGVYPVPSMAEIAFADGKFVVDDVYVTPIHEATEGVPGNFTYAEAMKRIGRVFEKRILREAQARIIGDHFTQWPRGSH